MISHELTGPCYTQSAFVVNLVCHSQKENKDYLATENTQSGSFIFNNLL
jgi:hypothetical protein